MLYPSINEIRKKADSRYTLVILAAKRARDIVDGKPILTEVDNDKPVSIAAHEIAEDLITYKRQPETESAAEEDAEILPELAETAELSELLAGARLERGALTELLSDVDIERYFHGLTKEDFINLLLQTE